MTYKELPGWYFRVQETSMNVYKVTGIDAMGRIVEREGVDLENLLEEIKQDAIGLEVNHKPTNS